VLTVGLTGGIGSGKSEVARRFAAYGAVLIDADAIAREVVAKGTPGLDAVVAEFGSGVLAADGSLDRELLAAVVFSDDGARRRLNAIVHPLVGQRSVELMAEAEAADPDAIVVHDVPLLVESGLQGLYDVVVVVATDAETQVRRLVEKRGMAEADARARIAAQATNQARLAVADIVIRNDGDLAELDDQARAAWSDLCDRAGRPTLT
jgi:dephospho-CoA kinase